MADANQAARELAEVMERVNYEMARYGQLSVQTQNDLTDAQMRAKYGVTNFTKAVNQGAQALAGLSKGAGETFAAMTMGSKGAKAANAGIDAMAGAAQGASKMLGSLFGFIPGVKALTAVFNQLVGVAADYTKEANKMSDSLYQTYSGLAQTGGAAADGMTGVFRGAKKLGLSMEEIGSYASLLGENSKDLSLFAGTVFEGRKQFEDMGAAMEPYRKSFLQLGYTQQELNDASMQYLRLQTRIGKSQNLTTEQLAEGARKYLTEQDALTKLTGMSRKEQEQALEAARSQTRFRAKLEEMRNSGDTQQIKAADELERQYVMLYKTSKRAAQGFGDLTTGMIDSDAAVELYQTSQGKALEVAEQMKASQMDAMVGFKQIGEAVGQTTKDFNMLHQMDAAGGFLLDIKEATELGIAAQRDIPKLYKKAQEETAAQMGTATDKNAKKLDNLTEAYSGLLRAQQRANELQEQNIFKLTEASTRLATSMADTSRIVAGEMGRLAKVIESVIQKMQGFLDFLNRMTVTKIWRMIMGSDVPDTPETKAAEEALERAKAAEEIALSRLSFLQRYNPMREDTPEETARKEAERGLIAAREQARLQQQRLGGAPGTPGSVGGPAAAPAGAGTVPVAPAPAGAAPTGGQTPAPPTVPRPPGGSAQEGSGPTPDFISMMEQRGRQNLDRIFSFGQRGPDSTRERFAALEDRLEARAIAAAQMFYERTGRPITLSSAVRTREEQEKLFAETDPATYDERTGLAIHRESGLPVLHPSRGGSHQNGTGIDILDTGRRFDPEAQGAFQTFLRQPLGARDPVHWSLADGGIARGPKTGYRATLHGDEAVIPLKNGAVPVRLQDEAFKTMQMQSIVDELMKRSQVIFGAKPTVVKPEVSVDLDLEQLQQYLKMEKLIDAVKGITPNNDQQLKLDLEAQLASTRQKIFAKMQDFKLDSMNREFDQELLENAMKMFKQAQPAAQPERTAVSDEEGLDRRTVMIDALRQNAASSQELVSLLSDLLRAQRDQNDISGRLLQVASN